MKTKYQILWIDDEWQTMESFKTHCLLQYGLELHPFKTRKEGLEDYALHEDYYEAAILDAKGLDESEHEVANVGSLQNAVMQIKEHYPNLPYFIFTGQEDLMSQSLFKSLFPDYYKKVIDDDRMCEDIIKAIEDKPNRRIVNKYPEIFSWLEPPIYEDVLDIIKSYEYGDTCNADVFNKIRKVMDWVFESLSDYSPLSLSFDGTNQNECSKLLANPKQNEYVPIYIQRNIHSLVVIANEGSHRLSIDESIRNGKAPYLIPATIFELLSVLVWLHQLLTNDESQIQNKITTKQ